MIKTPEIMISEHRTNGALRNERDDENTDRPRRRSDVILHELDGEALLFDPETQNTHRLNETAFLIWSSCDGTTTLDDIVTRLIDGYAVDRSQAEFHVSHLVTELRRQGLLVGPQKSPLLRSVSDNGVGRNRGPS